MNEQDSFFERTEQQILFSLKVKKLIEFDTYGNVAIA